MARKYTNSEKPYNKQTSAHNMSIKHIPTCTTVRARVTRTLLKFEISVSEPPNLEQVDGAASELKPLKDQLHAMARFCLKQVGRSQRMRRGTASFHRPFTTILTIAIFLSPSPSRWRCTPYSHSVLVTVYIPPLLSRRIPHRVHSGHA